METIFYFLPVIAIIGIITSYEDLKYGKVKNRWITIGVFASVIINFLIIFLNNNVNKNYYLDLMINISISLCIAFAFFYFDIWSEGDGKLFFMYASLLPITIYSNSYFKYFPSFSLLINIFLPYLIYSMAKVVLNPKKKNLSESMQEMFTKEFFISVLNIFSLSWVIQAILAKIGVANILLSIALTMIIYQYGLRMLTKKYKTLTITASIIIGISRFFFDKTIYTINFWMYFAIMIILFQMIFRSLLHMMLLKSSIKKAKIEELKENDVLAYTIKKIKGKIIIDEKLKNEETKEETIFLKEGTILLKKEIDKIKKEKSDFLIPIYKRIAFAHIIFLGVILTILLKGNILILLTKILS